MYALYSFAVINHLFWGRCTTQKWNNLEGGGGRWLTPVVYRYQLVLCGEEYQIMAIKHKHCFY